MLGLGQELGLDLHIGNPVLQCSPLKGGGVTPIEIDPTWMCDSMETRDAAPRVCPRSRETKDDALSGV